MKRTVLVFDIGNVLMNFRHELFHDFLLERGANIRSKEDFLQATRLIEFETGRISCKSFVTSIQALLGESTSEEMLVEKWNNIFTPATDMLSAVVDLRAKYPCYILSNTNEFHWNYLNRCYGLEKLVDGVVLSFQAGAMKPDPRIYRHLVEKFRLEDSEIIFLDDRIENTEAASDLGWKTICHFSFEKSLQKLLDFNINVSIPPAPLH